eukprot:TRINITY_DN25272_c0_g1_i1.p1 TRINITY_DN25272_c0_g1~~TRINITY_DN25272_c0_g1_i1.p1  ORF type:complete len:251 (+),score=50.82 TRINITY_DN25272_c0_g1_i1:69-755(+)
MLGLHLRRNVARTLVQMRCQSDKSELRKQSGVKLRVRTEAEERMKEGKKLFEMGEKDRDPEESGSKEEMRKLAAGIVTICFFSLGGTMLAVPLYKMYCTTSPQIGGGVNKHVENIFDGESNRPNISSVINVIFRGAVGQKESPVLFVPLQTQMDVLIGEPALAFFNVYNKTAKTLIGISTYNVAPAEASQYFNKIQCFCFEEQRIKPNELIEMPVFFFVDKEYLEVCI